MTRAPLVITLLLLATLLPAPGIRAQGKQKNPQAPQLQINSDRWQKLDPAKRSQIEKIYQQLRTLPADKQKQLLSKLRKMKPEDRRSAVREARQKLAMPPHERELQKKHHELLRQSWNRLPPQEQERLMKMKPESRKKHLHERYMAQRTRILERLPENLRRRVLTMTPPQQADFLRKHKARATSEKIFNEQEIVKLRSLDHKQLRRLFHPPRKDSPAPAHKPDFLSDSSWEKWNALRPYERPRSLDSFSGKTADIPRTGAMAAGRRRAQVDASSRREAKEAVGALSR